MFATLARRMATANPPPPPPLTTTTTTTATYTLSRHRPKKVWPPDFSKLSEAEQFRFEKRYKRRVKLASARPRWDRYVKLAQLGTVTFVIVYSVLFMDWNSDSKPFEGVRSRFWGFFSPRERPVRQSPDLPTTADGK